MQYAVHDRLEYGQCHWHSIWQAIIPEQPFGCVNHKEVFTIIIYRELQAGLWQVSLVKIQPLVKRANMSSVVGIGYVFVSTHWFIVTLKSPHTLNLPLASYFLVLLPMVWPVHFFWQVLMCPPAAFCLILLLWQAVMHRLLTGSS